jgi:hypothetical protein
MAMDTHTWISNPQTGGQWQCPNEALEHHLSQGWEQMDEAPPEPNPAIAERLAAQRKEAEAAEDSEKEPQPKAAARGKTKE